MHQMHTHRNQKNSTALPAAPGKARCRTCSLKQKRGSTHKKDKTCQFPTAWQPQLPCSLRQHVTASKGRHHTHHKQKANAKHEVTTNRRSQPRYSPTLHFKLPRRQAFTEFPLAHAVKSKPHTMSQAKVVGTPLQSARRVLPPSRPHKTDLNACPAIVPHKEVCNAAQRIHDYRANKKPHDIQHGTAHLLQNALYLALRQSCIWPQAAVTHTPRQHTPVADSLA